MIRKGKNNASSGISGDMTIGALLDLGIDQEAFQSELAKLHLDGYTIQFEKVVRNAITMNYANVLVEKKERDEREHYHAESAHHHYHHEHSGHFHRSFCDIKAMIQNSELETEVKELALKIFTRVLKR